MTSISINSKKCGVVILNYNSHDLTVNLANKIADFPSIAYVCVVDNNSNDSFDGEFDHEKIRYIKSVTNKGYSGGNNIGLKYLIEICGCNIVFIANPDVDFSNNTIDELCSTLIGDRDIVIASSKRYGINNQIIHQFFNFPTFKSAIKNCFFITRRKFDETNHKIQNELVDNANGIIYVDAVPGAFFAIKSDFLLEIGYLYEGIFLYGEEIVLGRQASILGYKCAIINTTHYNHNHVKSGRSNRKMFWYDRVSLRKYYRKFNLLSGVQYLVLDLSIILGTAEYIVLHTIHDMYNKFRFFFQNLGAK